MNKKYVFSEIYVKYIFHNSSYKKMDVSQLQNLHNSQNPTESYNSCYAGLLYAFGASGGFVIEQGIDRILLRIEDLLQQYDVTNALEVKMDVALFNYKLGLIKNLLNNEVIDSSFNYETDEFPVDSITLSAEEFIENVTYDSILCLGRLSTLYSDFMSYVQAYFGFSGGYASLFSGDQEFNINNGIFDASAFIKLIHYQAPDGKGSYIKDLSGSVVISNLNELLRNAVDANVFGNRDPSNGTTAVDPMNHANYGVNDGFIDGDLIFVPYGITATLNLNIDSEVFNPVNNIGPTNLTEFLSTHQSSNGQYFTTTINSTLNNITTTITAPLLIRLTNKYYPNPDIDVFQYSWNIIMNDVENNSFDTFYTNNIASSAAGEYKSFIGLNCIYISNDYGNTWKKITKDTDNNAFELQELDVLYKNINISNEGKYQIFGYGSNFYTSSDYGETWNKSKNTINGTNHYTDCATAISEEGGVIVVANDDVLMVSNSSGMTFNTITHTTDNTPIGNISAIEISADGLYQTAVDFNNSVIYISSDYGYNWEVKTGFIDGGWNGVALSADGLYQAVSSWLGPLYTSNDYGKTWNIVANDVSGNCIDNMIWKGISISPDGKYQASLNATDSYIYYSKDYGATWQKALSVGQVSCTGISISSKNVVLSGGDNPYIYISPYFFDDPY